MPPGGEKRSTLRDLDLERHVADPDIKQRYVTAMFDLVAPRYDQFTRWFSYGLDRRWKGELLAEAAARVVPGTVVLDVACGTGDLALGLREVDAEITVVGLDPSGEMLAGCRRRGRAVDAAGPPSLHRGAAAVHLVRGDLMSLPAPASSVAMVTVGYGLRNVPDVAAALAEIGRVLRPDGWLLSLEFFRPASMLGAALFLHYLRLAGRLYGWWWHREPNAYGYIAESVRRFLTRDEFRMALARAGFETIVSRRKLGGGIGLHVARRR
jgi:demethylmenaquinone methyltransferase/2-methoxy-6-polyprenyl-1,4-benzoquinol methylase